MSMAYNSLSENRPPRMKSRPLDPSMPTWPFIHMACTESPSVRRPLTVGAERKVVWLNRSFGRGFHGAASLVIKRAHKASSSFFMDARPFFLQSSIKKLQVKMFLPCSFLSVSVFVKGGLDKAHKQRMGTVGPAFEFGVILHAEIKRAIR